MTLDWDARVWDWLSGEQSLAWRFLPGMPANATEVSIGQLLLERQVGCDASIEPDRSIEPQKTVARSNTLLLAEAERLGLDDVPGFNGRDALVVASGRYRASPPLIPGYASRNGRLQGSTIADWSGVAASFDGGSVLMVGDLMAILDEGPVVGNTRFRTGPRSQSATVCAHFRATRATPPPSAS